MPTRLHSLSLDSWERMFRPSEPSMHGKKPNEILQLHYIELGRSSDGNNNLVMLINDHPSYSWIFAFSSATAENAGFLNLDYCAAFGKPKWFISDGSTHFQNETVRIFPRFSRPRTTLQYPTVHVITMQSSSLARNSFENSAQDFYELKLCSRECSKLTTTREKCVR